MPLLSATFADIVYPLHRIELGVEKLVFCALLLKHILGGLCKPFDGPFVVGDTLVDLTERIASP